MQIGTRCVLIVGGSGFIGTQLALKLRDHFKVFATYHKNSIHIPGVTSIPFDITKKDWVKRVVFTAQPEIVIYAIGNPSLEWCAEHTNEAERVHLDGPSTLAIMIGMMQPRFIFLSSPYVFDGSVGNYHENDMINPGTVLGRMKSGAENVVRSKLSNFIILRVSPVIGRGNGKNSSYLDRLRIALDRNQRFEASNQELHSFIVADSFAEVVKRLIDSGLKNRVVHYGGITKVTYYEFAKEFAKRFGYDESLISPKAQPPVTTAGLGEDFIFDFSLNSTPAIEALKIKPLLLEESLDLIEKQLVPGR
jgi:dTDP-4-dehydrorhamnose reductase